MRVVGLLVVIVILAVVISRFLKKKPNPRDNYICDVCGEHECLCHKEDKGA